jgi:exonuclease VII large subunit
MLINGYVTIQQVNDLSFIHNLTGSNTFVLRGLTTQFIDSTHIQVNAGACLINGVLIELNQNVVVRFNSQNVTSPTIINGQYNLVISMQQTQLNRNFSSQGIYPYSVFLQFELTHSTNEIVLANVQCNNNQITSLTHVPLPTFLSLINASVPSVTTLQTILDNVLTSSGFNSIGAYQPPTNAGELSQATSLSSADLTLYNMISSILNDISTIETSAGLSSTGQYTPNINTNYIATATSLNNADVLLDSSIKTVTNSLQNFENTTGTQIENLNTSINNINNATGLSSTSQYVPNNNTTYIKSATSLNEADVLLDRQLNSLNEQLSQEISTRTTQNTSIENQISTIQTSTGLSSNGSYVANSNSNYIKSATSLNEADVLLDSSIKTVTNSLQNFENTTGTQIENLNTSINNINNAAGLSSNGSYVPNSNSNYIKTATSLNDADVLLDKQLNSLNEQLSQEISTRTSQNTIVENQISTIQTSSGLSSNGSYVPNSNSNYIKTATSLNDADVLLDKQLNSLNDQLSQEISTRTTQNTTIQNQISTIQTSSGLSSNGSYVANPNTNYIKSATSLNDADFLLDSALYTVSNSLSTLSNNVNNNSTLINNIISASGLTSVGTYTPAPTSEYISNATSLASATELLNNAITSVNNSLTTFEKELASTNGASLVGVKQPLVNAPNATTVQDALASFDQTFLTTVKKFTYTATVSDTTFTISHNLNNSSPVVFVYNNGTQINPTSITIVDANNITVTFSSAIQPTIVVIG